METALILAQITRRQEIRNARKVGRKMFQSRYLQEQDGYFSSSNSIYYVFILYIYIPVQNQNFELFLQYFLTKVIREAAKKSFLPIAV